MARQRFGDKQGRRSPSSHDRQRIVADAEGERGTAHFLCDYIRVLYNNVRGRLDTTNGTASRRPTRRAARSRWLPTSGDVLTAQADATRHRVGVEDEGATTTYRRPGGNPTSGTGLDASTGGAEWAYCSQAADGSTTCRGTVVP